MAVELTFSTPYEVRDGGRFAEIIEEVASSGNTPSMDSTNITVGYSSGEFTITLPVDSLPTPAEDAIESAIQDRYPGVQLEE